MGLNLTWPDVAVIGMAILAALCTAVQGPVGDTVRAAQDTLCRLYMGRIRERVRDKMREGSEGPREYPTTFGEDCLAEVALLRPIELTAGDDGYRLGRGFCGLSAFWNNGPDKVATMLFITKADCDKLRSALYHRPRAPEPAAICAKLNRRKP